MLVATRKLLLCVCIGTVLVAAPAGAVPESAMGTLPTTFDMEFFSFDGPLRGAAASHSFVRLRRIQGDRITEVVDISWLPDPRYFRRNGRVPLLREVPGRNYSLEETFAIAGGRPVFTHGRFEVAPELFEAARRRRNDLESGVAGYKLLDGRRFPSATNCIHAISGILAYLNTGLRRGATATNSLVGFFLSTGLAWSSGSRPPLFPPSSQPQPPATPPIAQDSPPTFAPPAPPTPPTPPAFAPPTHEYPSAPPQPFVQAPVQRRRPILGFLRRR